MDVSARARHAARRMTTLADEIERLAKAALAPADLRSRGLYNTASLLERIPAIITALRGAEQVREKAALGPEQRCPNCGVKFPECHDVDAHLRAIREDRT